MTDSIGTRDQKRNRNRKHEGLARPVVDDRFDWTRLEPTGLAKLALHAWCGTRNGFIRLGTWSSVAGKPKTIFFAWWKENWTTEGTLTEREPVAVAAKWPFRINQTGKKKAITLVRKKKQDHGLRQSYHPDCSRCLAASSVEGPACNFTLRKAFIGASWPNEFLWNRVRWWRLHLKTATRSIGSESIHPWHRCLGTGVGALRSAISEIPLCCPSRRRRGFTGLVRWCGHGRPPSIPHRCARPYVSI